MRKQFATRRQFAARAQGDTAPPVISSEAYNSVTNILTADVSEAGQYYAVWSQTAVLTAGAIRILAIAGGTGTATGYYVSGIQTAITVEDAALTPGTWYLQWAVYDFAGNGALGTPQSKVVAAGKIEIWDAYANGNNYTQLSASGTPYTRNSANVRSDVLTDANAASGSSVGLLVGLISGTTPIGLARNDITSILGARTTSDTVNVLARFHITQTIAAASAGIGWLNGSNFTGIRLRRAAANANAVAMLIDGDLAAAATNTANLTGLLSGLANGSTVCARFQINGDTMNAKAWAGTLASEPATPTTGFTSLVNPAGAGINLAFSNLGFYARTSNDGLISVGYSVVLNATAPGF